MCSSLMQKGEWNGVSVDIWLHRLIFRGNILISQFRGGDQSESEAELDGDQNEVVLPQDMAGRGNVKSAKSAIRLV